MCACTPTPHPPPHTVRHCSWRRPFARFTAASPCSPQCMTASRFLEVQSAAATPPFPPRTCSARTPHSTLLRPVMLFWCPTLAKPWCRLAMCLCPCVAGTGFMAGKGAHPFERIMRDARILWVGLPLWPRGPVPPTHSLTPPSAPCLLPTALQKGVLPLATVCAPFTAAPPCLNCAPPA